MGRHNAVVLYRVLMLGAFVVLPIALWAGEASALPLIGLLALPMAFAPMRAMTNRTDGPALNGALAATGAVLGVYSLLVTAGLLISSWPRRLGPGEKLWSANRLGRGHPLRAALPRALRDRARQPRPSARWCCCGCAPRTGLTGLGEAVPLSLRGGADAGPGGRRAGAARRARRAGRGGPARRRRQPLGPGPLRGADRAARPARDGGRRREGARAPAASEPVRCNATLVAGEPAAVADDALRWAAEGFSTFKLKLGRRRRRRPGAGGARGGRPRGADPGRRQRAPGTWTTRSGRCGELEELDIELAEQPVATLEEAAEVAAATSIPIAGDESIESRGDAERAVATRRLRPDRSQALQGRRAGGGDRDRRGAPFLHLQRPRRPGRDRRRGPGGADAERDQRRTAASTSPTASRPSASSPRPSPRPSASCATGSCTCPAAPASASRSTSARSTTIGFSLRSCLL